jgi:hypothetical protein
MRTKVARLLLCALTVLPICALDSHFDRPFQNEMHAPRAEDADIVRILTNKEDKHLRRADFLVVHGHFCGDGTQAAIVTAYWHASQDDSTATFLFSKETGGWTLKSREHWNRGDPSYCRVVPASPVKDVLLCQTIYAGNVARYDRDEVDTNLDIADYSETPLNYYVLQLRDTVASGTQYLTWANLKSVAFQSGLLHAGVEYGRKQVPPHSHASRSAFPHQLYKLDFELGPKGFSPTEGTYKDFQHVTEFWEKPLLHQ